MPEHSDCAGSPDQSPHRRPRYPTQSRSYPNSPPPTYRASARPPYRRVPSPHSPATAGVPPRHSFGHSHSCHIHFPPEPLISAHHDRTATARSPAITAQYIYQRPSYTARPYTGPGYLGFSTDRVATRPNPTPHRHKAPAAGAPTSPPPDTCERTPQYHDYPT